MPAELSPLNPVDGYRHAKRPFPLTFLAAAACGWPSASSPPFFAPPRLERFVLRPLWRPCAGACALGAAARCAELPTIAHDHLDDVAVTSSR